MNIKITLQNIFNKLIPLVLIYSLAFILIAIFSCTDNFDELNRDKTKLTKDQINEKKTIIEGNDSMSIDTVVISLGKNIITIYDTIQPGPIEINGDPGDFFFKFSYEGPIANHQRATNLFHDLYAHYFANNKFATSPHYLYSDSWMKTRWEEFYINRYQEFKSIIGICQQDSKNHFNNSYNIAWINFYYLASMMTDTYGPIPFSNIIERMKAEIYINKIKGDILKLSKSILEKEKELESSLNKKEIVHLIDSLSNRIVTQKRFQKRVESALVDFAVIYDTQEEVYKNILSGLKKHQANLNLAPDKGTNKLKSTDNIYGGDVLKWKKFANSLRLRLAMRIVNINPKLAKQEAEAAISEGLLETNDDTYAVHYYNGSGGHENDYALVGFIYGDVVLSKDLENMDRNHSDMGLDPRCTKCWFKNLTSHSNVLNSNENPIGDYVGKESGSPDTHHHDDRYSYLKSKKLIMDDNFWFDYNRQFECLNYAEVKFLLAEASLRGWNTSKSVKDYYEDGIKASMDYYKVPTGMINYYIKMLKNNPFSGSNKELILEQIINQKWLANFPNGCEGWADFRRTDYPKLSNLVLNKSNDVPQGKFIKRIMYPVSEHDLNKEHVYYKLINDKQGLKVWWDIQDTNDDSGNRSNINNFR